MIRKNLGFFLLIIIFSFFFFFRLGWDSLSSWDEAWYGSIAKEITKTGDFINLKWNGNPYYDHPPIGFWLMAISYKVFGVNEFSTRLPSAILGLLTIIVVYLIADELFNEKTIAFITSLILGTSVWYVLRVRSGNLDSVLIFFYATTIYFSLKSSKSFHWFPVTLVSLACLLLSKTLFGASAILLVFFLNLKQFLNIRKNLITVVVALLLFSIIFIPWYYWQSRHFPDFLNYHFFTLGMRGKTLMSVFDIKLDPSLFYLHMGVRKWYYLWILSCVFLFISLNFINQKIFLLFFWNILVLFPFLSSKKTELWHLIPVYLPICFLTAYGIFAMFLRVLKNKKLTKILYLLFFLAIAGIQIKTFFFEVIPTKKYTPDEVDIAQKAEKYTQDIYLVDDFLPRVVFYSKHNIIPLMYEKDGEQALVKLYRSDRQNFVVIASSWMGEQLKEAQIPYKTLEKNNSFSIFSRFD